MQVFETALMEHAGEKLTPGLHGYASYPTKIIDVQETQSIWTPQYRAVRREKEVTWAVERPGDPCVIRAWFRNTQGPTASAAALSPIFYEVSTFTQDWAKLSTFLKYFDDWLYQHTGIHACANAHFRSLWGSNTPGSLLAAKRTYHALMFRKAGPQSIGFSEYMARLLEEFLKLAPSYSNSTPRECLTVAQVSAKD